MLPSRTGCQGLSSSATSRAHGGEEKNVLAKGSDHGFKAPAVVSDEVPDFSFQK